MVWQSGAAGVHLSPLMLLTLSVVRGRPLTSRSVTSRITQLGVVVTAGVVPVAFSILTVCPGSRGTGQ
jgi:hypothetical protein